MTEVLGIPAFFLAVVLAFFSTKWYMSNSVTITSGIGGLLNLYYKQFVIFFIIWLVVLCGIIGLIVNFLAAYGKYLAVGIAVIGGLAAYGSKDDGTQKHQYILIGTIILALGVYFVSDSEHEKAAIKQRAHDQELLDAWNQIKQESGINNKKYNKPDTSADRQTDVPRDEKPAILFDFSKYGIYDVTEEEQLEANASKNAGKDDESTIKRFWIVRQINGGKPLDRSKPMGQTDNIIPNDRYLDGDDLYLGNIGLDDPADSVKKKMGTVNMEEIKNPDGSIMYKYNMLMDIKVKDGEIVYIAADTPNIKTPRSICGDKSKDETFNNGMTIKNNGSTLKEVLNSYGRRDAILSDGGDLDFYEYEVHSKKGHLSMIRFAVRKDNQRVEYVSMRRL